jgi:hypothetical protein
MTRTWPFEGRGEPEEPFHDPESFVARRGRNTEAVVVRLGLHDAQLVLVDDHGRWERWVYGSVDEAKRRARALGVEVHVGSYPEATRVRMNAYVRPPEDFARGAYPEQGRVGPVIPYPENRRPPGPELVADEPESDPLHPGLAP